MKHRAFISAPLWSSSINSPFPLLLWIPRSSYQVHSANQKRRFTTASKQLCVSTIPSYESTTAFTETYRKACSEDVCKGEMQKAANEALQDGNLSHPGASRQQRVRWAGSHGRTKPAQFWAGTGTQLPAPQCSQIHRPSAGKGVLGVLINGFLWPVCRW